MDLSIAESFDFRENSNIDFDLSIFCDEISSVSDNEDEIGFTLCKLILFLLFRMFFVLNFQTDLFS